MTEETAPYGTGAGSTAPSATPRKRVRTHHLRELKQRGERFAMLTAYDMYTAEVFDEAGIEVLLVGDSASNNVYGNATSLPVTVEELLPLTRAVSRSAAHALVVGDLPFGSYQRSPEQAYDTAVRFMKEGGAHTVKLEGGREVAPQIELLTRGGVPVMAHIGFTPQSEHTLGGYRVQGRGDEAAATLKRHAIELQDAGASLLVLEMVPAALSAEITQALPRCATIGIGAGVDCAGQVLVLHDMLGMNLGKMPKFVHNFMADAGSVRGAMEAYVKAVKEKTFPVNATHAW